MSHRYPSARTTLALLASLPALLVAPNLHAQGLATATRSAELSAFAGASYLRPDYGDKDQLGFFLGADYTRFYRLLSPSLEIRAAVSPVGSVVGERIYSGGLKLSHPLRRFNPYADLLLGAGTLLYDSPTPSGNGTFVTSDNGKVYTFGGGVDIPVTRHFSAKIDGQYNNWSLGNDFTLTPIQLNIGVIWHTF